MPWSRQMSCFGSACTKPNENNSNNNYGYMFVPIENVPEPVKRRYRQRGEITFNGITVKRPTNNNNINWPFYPPIKWAEKTVNQLPNNNAISFNNFKNGDKAIRYKVGNKNMYMKPTTFKSLLRPAKLNMTLAYNTPSNTNLFKSPFTREMVKRKNIDFVILKKK